MASEATMAVRGNMHMDTKVIKVVDFKSEVIRPPMLFGGSDQLLLSLSHVGL